jgi:hypothetical protein
LTAQPSLVGGVSPGPAGVYYPYDYRKRFEKEIAMNTARLFTRTTLSHRPLNLSAAFAALWTHLRGLLDHFQKPADEPFAIRYIQDKYKGSWD